MESKNTITVISSEENEILRLNRRVIDESPDLIAVVGADCRYHYVNPAYLSIHQLSHDDIIGKHLREVLGEEVYDTIVAPRIETCLAGEAMKYESPFDFGDAGTFFMEVRYLPLFNEDDTVDRVVIITRDISERRKTEVELRKSTAFLYNIINALDDPICVKDQDYSYVVVNESLCDAVGMTKDELAGKTDYDVYSRSEADALRTTDEFVLRTGDTNISENELTWLGFTHFVSIKKSLFVDPVSGRKYLVEAMRDITDRKLTEEKLAYIATHDGLTGLPNRSLFNEFLSSALLLASRYKHQMAVMLLDLDKFKDVNDTLGHRVGDILLESVSDRLRELLRKSDTVARMSGDEFLLLLPEIQDSAEADMVAGKVIEAMAEPFQCDSHTISITFSIGVSLYPDDGKDTETLIRHADIAMYASKRSHRDGFKRFTADMDMNVMPR